MKADMHLDEIARLTKLSIGDADGHKVCDERAVLRLIGVHIPELCATIADQNTTIAYLKSREQSIIDACERVADGGQYRADIVAAIQTIRSQRDEARAEVERLRAELAKAQPSTRTHRDT
jgi:hypothetical protein